MTHEHPVSDAWGSLHTDLYNLLEIWRNQKAENVQNILRQCCLDNPLLIEIFQQDFVEALCFGGMKQEDENRVIRGLTEEVYRTTKKFYSQEIQTFLNGLNSRTQALDGKMKQMEKNVLETLKETAQHFETEIEKWKTQCNTLSQQNDVLKEQIRCLENTRNASKSVVDVTNTNNAALVHEVQSLTIRCQELLRLNIELTKENENSTQMIQDLAAALEEESSKSSENTVSLLHSSSESIVSDADLPVGFQENKMLKQCLSLDLLNRSHTTTCCSEYKKLLNMLASSGEMPLVKETDGRLKNKNIKQLELAKNDRKIPDWILTMQMLRYSLILSKATDIYVECLLKDNKDNLERWRKHRRAICTHVFFEVKFSTKTDKLELKDDESLPVLITKLLDTACF